MIVEPCRLVHQSNADIIVEQPRLIIIDGLDECVIRKHQAEIVEAFAGSLSMDPISGLRVLLTSRPELEIRQAFNMDSIYPLCTRLVLDDTFDPDKDIDLYLRSHFQAIKRQHVMGSTLPVTWPSDDAISEIVKKSSGQFIYASTVIRYISDPRRDPKKRLDMILKILPENGDKPFAQLDLLYSSILLVCEDYKKTALIFGAIMFIEAPGKGILHSLEDLEALLSLKGEILLVLADLHSIVDLNNIDVAGIRFHHASLYDYLMDVSRSHAFYVDKLSAHADLSILCLNKLLNAPSEVSRHDVILTYSMESWTFHYRYSAWDKRVLSYVCDNGLLTSGNRQMEQAFHCYESHPRREGTSGAAYTSLLGQLIHDGSTEKDAIKLVESAHNIINAEFLNQLAQYPCQEIIFLLYHLILFEPHSLLETGTKIYGETFDLTSYPRTNNITDKDIFLYHSIRMWFKDLMQATGYVYKLPEDVHERSICYLMDLIMDNSSDHYVDLYHRSTSEAVRKIFENIPLSNGIAQAILKKWETMKNEDLILTNSALSVIEVYIQGYCQRVAQKSTEL